MLRINKQDIMELPISNWATLNLDDLGEALKADPLHPFSSWLLPQLVAWFGSWKVLENGMDMVKHNCDTTLKRVLYSISRVPRSLLVPKQIAQPEYSRFTPLIALGLKRMQGIKYEFWRGFDGREWILERDLLEAVDVVCPDLGSEELIKLRDHGLLTRSGPKAGQYKSAESTWSLSGLNETPLGKMPKLTQTMLCQCWLAHPKYRRETMILDPLDWDHMPDPLISAEIFKPSEIVEIKPKKPTQALPWD